MTIARYLWVGSFACSSMITHFKCRNGAYPRTEGSIVRQMTPDDFVHWERDWAEYEPPYYTSEQVKNQIWSDPELECNSFQPSWNKLDEKVNRKSFHGDYKLLGGYPLNPAGRTGLRGRGVLGRWGPNHAADPIITRWKKINRNIVMNTNTEKPVLEFVAIKRRDCNECAIPGGMVDPGELVTNTLKREFLEEALNSLEMTESGRQEMENKMADFFSSGTCIYSGYVDDIRNTDNAWIETSAYNFHDNDGLFESVPLNAGDDAIGVFWLDLSQEFPLYASHSKLLELVAVKHGAHW